MLSQVKPFPVRIAIASDFGLPLRFQERTTVSNSEAVPYCIWLSHAEVVSAKAKARIMKQAWGLDAATVVMVKF